MALELCSLMEGSIKGSYSEVQVTTCFGAELQQTCWMVALVVMSFTEVMVEVKITCLDVRATTKYMEEVATATYMVVKETTLSKLNQFQMLNLLVIGTSGAAKAMTKFMEEEETTGSMVARAMTI